MNLALASSLDDLLRGLPNLIELPMPRWIFIGRVQNRVIKKFIRHVGCRSPRFSLVESMLSSPARGMPQQRFPEAPGPGGSTTGRYQ